MTRVNPDNEYVKRRYFHHLRESEGLAPATIDHACRAIAQFEAHTDWQDFKRFTYKLAVKFKKSLMSNGGRRSAQLSARATLYTKLNHLEMFFKWLAEQPGYRSRLKIADARYFHLSRHDARIAQERPEQPAPTLEQIHRAINAMPAATDVELRNRAIMAFLILTGARVNAIRTFKLKHLLRHRRGIRQDAREVRTKGSKTFTTFFFPVGDDLRDIFLGYVDHLRDSLGFGPDDPLFPSTAQAQRIGRMFAVCGLTRGHWKTADPVRSICREAFAAAGLPYYNPHSFRRTLALLAEERSPIELKAWSQNLGHDQLLTTLTSYGTLPEARQAELVMGMRQRAQASEDIRELAKQIAEVLSEESLPRNFVKEVR